MARRNRREILSSDGPGQKPRTDRFLHKRELPTICHAIKGVGLWGEGLCHRRWLNGASRNTYELMRQIPEDRGHVAAASILIAGSERRPKFTLLASVKSVFPRGFDVG